MTGRIDAKPGTDHSRSPLEKYKQWLLELIATKADLTLELIAIEPDPTLAEIVRQTALALADDRVAGDDLVVVADEGWWTRGEGPNPEESDT